MLHDQLHVYHSKPHLPPRGFQPPPLPISSPSCTQSSACTHGRPLQGAPSASACVSLRTTHISDTGIFRGCQGGTLQGRPRVTARVSLLCAGDCAPEQPLGFQQLPTHAAMDYKSHCTLVAPCGQRQRHPAGCHSRCTGGPPGFRRPGLPPASTSASRTTGIMMRYALHA